MQRATVTFHVPPDRFNPYRLGQQTTFKEELGIGDTLTVIDELGVLAEVSVVRIEDRNLWQSILSRLKR